jgi:tetratricopeptide (TPR) repeat protein
LAAAAVLFVTLAPAPDVAKTIPSSTAPERLPDEDAPWTQSQLAEARTKSQDILKNLLDSKKALEEKGVEDWAADGFSAALELAEQGDEHYKQQDFAAALSSYQAAVDKMDSLFDFLPREISRLLRVGEQALGEGKSQLAKQQFNRVLELDEENLEAVAGIDKANRLDQVLGLIAAAKADETAYEESADLADLQSARAHLEEARSLDDDYPAVTTGLQRVESLIADTQYKSAMTEAYQALFANRYSAARTAFARALKIKPGDQQAKRAMQQALASDQSASIASLLQAAKRYENQEEWASANTNYQTVLQRDPNQVDAKLGEIRSGARLQLDQQLQDVLSDPLALSRSEPKKIAQAVLKDASAIGNPGPRLSGQINQLAAYLEQSDAVVRVTLLSDNVTDVTLQKVGSKPIQLGQFSEKNLALKPGRYVATGVRLGFQDVRKDIDLLPKDGDIQSFTIQCSEAVQGSVASGD